MKNIITIQHTQSEQHINNMMGGNTDWPLTETGKRQAHNIGKNIKNLINMDNSIIYSSDLLRAKQTANIVNEYINLNIIYKKELQEINVGEAKGKSKEWDDKNCAPKDNISMIHYRAFPNAETFEEVYNRITPVMDEILNNEYENVIVVGHGLCLTLFILQWLKLPIEYIDKIAFGASAGGVSFLTLWENKRMLKQYNITSYKE
ncbi:histidine phosphatase family protein [Spirochaetia bacterium]|nr:histidine phosphatase family protein [Spirochaetia bacterium]